MRVEIFTIWWPSLRVLTGKTYHFLGMCTSQSGARSICSIIANSLENLACPFCVCLSFGFVFVLVLYCCFSFGHAIFVRTAAKHYKWYFEKYNTPCSSRWVAGNENSCDRPMDECIFDDRMRMINGFVHHIFICSLDANAFHTFAIVVGDFLFAPRLLCARVRE